MAGQPDEIEVFAEHLRDLKDRTGRSYGALAERLHIGRSTLHRYCLGETVPVDYAVVDRLARLAKAPREELVELHRQWVLADEARARALRREQTEGADRADPVDPGDRTESTADQTTPPAEAKTDAPSPPEEAVVDVTTNAEDERRTPHRPTAGRLRWVVAAGAAAALVAIALVAADLAGGPSGEEPQGTGPATSATSTSSATSATRNPPTWSADSHVWAHGCDHRYLVDRSPAAVPAPPVEQDARQWATALGAVHGDTTIVRATVTAPEGGTAVVERLSVRVVARRPSLTWSAYGMSNGCGGMLSPAYYAVDLDAARPLAHPMDGFDGERPLPATRLPYRVTEADPLVVRVEATAARCDCDWYLEAEWTSGDRRGTLRIDDGGKPFRTSGYAAEKEYGYAGERGSWGR